MRKPQGGGAVPGDQDPRRGPAQGRQLHHGHPRLEEKVRGPRKVPVCPAEKVWRERLSGKKAAL